MWSATKTHPSPLVVQIRMPFRPSAIRGHSTVAPPITVPVDQSQRSSQHSTRLWYCKQQQQGIINVVQCKGGHPFVDPTENVGGPDSATCIYKGKTPSEYYLLRSETLQDIAVNAMFNNYGCGHDDLPPPLQRMYHNHIYNYNNE